MFQFFSRNEKKPNTKNNFGRNKKIKILNPNKFGFYLISKIFGTSLKDVPSYCYISNYRLLVQSESGCATKNKFTIHSKLHFNKELFLWVEKLRHCFGVRHCVYFSIGQYQHRYQADPNMEL